MRNASPSDLTDARWAILEPLTPAHRVGRPRRVEMRGVLNAILYLTRPGCQWDTLPHDLLPKSTVYDPLARWRDDGTWQHVMDALRQRVRTSAGRDPNPGVASIDSQTVQGSEVGGERGHDGGKKLRGRKRHIVVDSLGLLLVVAVAAASAADGTAAPKALRRLTAEDRSRLTKVRGDRTSRNHASDRWMKRNRVGYVIEAVGRPAGSVGYVTPPKRWVVERAFARLGRSRRNSRDYERRPGSSGSMIEACSIHQMLRRSSPNPGKANPFRYRGKPEVIAG